MLIVILSKNQSVISYFELKVFVFFDLHHSIIIITF